MMIPVSEATQFYPYEPTLVWNEITYLWNEMLWGAEPIGHRLVAGNRFTLRYPQDICEQFNGMIECEITALVPGRIFCMVWIPQVASGMSSRYELLFAFEARPRGSWLKFTLAASDLSDERDCAFSCTLALGAERVLAALGNHLDYVAAAHMGAAS